MTTYCTYCSALKKNSKEAIPAIDLYNSNRISQIYELAKLQKVNFVILSGKYGIIEANEKIEFYDHLLQNSEVEKHIELIVEQLQEKEIDKIVFFTNFLEIDFKLKPYWKCMQKACEILNIELIIKEQLFND